MDVVNFYIQTILKDYQYLQFHIGMIPQEIINKYNLQDIVHSLLLKGVHPWCDQLICSHISYLVPTHIIGEVTAMSPAIPFAFLFWLSLFMEHGARAGSSGIKMSITRL